MMVKDWIKRVISGRSREMTGIPDPIGRITDERGRRYTVRRGDRKHTALTSDQLQRVVRLREVLAGVYPMTMEGWVDGFLRDVDPEREIQIIEAVAAVYVQLTAGAPLSREEKKGLYGLLCVISAGAVSADLAGLIPQNKGLPELSELVEMYREARAAGARP